MSSKPDDNTDELMQMLNAVIHKVDSLSDEVNHLKYRVAMLEESGKIHGHTSSMQQHSDTRVSVDCVGQVSEQLEHLHRSITCSVFFNNPLNMMFSGMKVPRGANLDDAFRMFMVETLHVADDRAYSMSLHVQYLPSMTSEERVAPPICVTLRSTKDKEHLQHKCDVHYDLLSQAGVTARSSYWTQAGVRYWKTR